MLFDTHAHYDDERFDEDRDALLASMPENNVGLILNPGCDAGTSRKAVGYANRYPFVYAAVGLHPENIEDGWTQTLDEIRTLAQSEPRVRAIGEIGLDYYWEKEERARARQQVVFARQMELARELKLPVIVHDRDAHADCMEITRRYPDVIGVYLTATPVTLEWRVSCLSAAIFCPSPALSPLKMRKKQSKSSARCRSNG